MKILMVLTSHSQLGNTGRTTGFWLEEFAAPYFVFRDAGVELTLASPKGGQPPVDPKSDLPENQTPAMARFKKDATAQKALANTVKLADMKSEDFDTVFYVGGHGPMWDLAESPVSIALLESFYNSGKVIALVCHSPGVLRHVRYQGEPLVKGKRLTGFTNEEEAEVGLTHVVPFLVEDELTRLGAKFEKVPNWQPFAIVDGRLITGQNPASSTSAAKALLNLLAQQPANSAATPNPLDVVPDEIPFDVPYGLPIPLAKAQAAIDAAVAEAAQRKWKMNVAIADSGGNLVAFQRMDGAMLASIQIAEHKAKAAATFRRPTKIFEDGIQRMHLNYLLAFDGVIASRGGIPLIDQGAIVGAIGCSGGTDSQDEIVSKAGAAVINQR